MTGKYAFVAAEQQNELTRGSAGQRTIKNHRTAKGIFIVIIPKRHSFGIRFDGWQSA